MVNVANCIRAILFLTPLVKDGLVSVSNPKILSWSSAGNISSNFSGVSTRIISPLNHDSSRLSISSLAIFSMNPNYKVECTIVKDYVKKLITNILNDELPHDEKKIACLC